MPLFEMVVDPAAPKYPGGKTGDLVSELILEGGNKAFEMEKADYGKTTVVKCDKKPLHSHLFGVSWVEREEKINEPE